MLTPRFFLKSSGLALVSFGAVPHVLLRSVSAAEGAKQKKTLVVVFQRGACDGLNTVIPYGENAYRAPRPSIPVPPPNARATDPALDLHRFLGLPPPPQP